MIMIMKLITIAIMILSLAGCAVYGQVPLPVSLSDTDEVKKSYLDDNLVQLRGKDDNIYVASIVAEYMIGSSIKAPGLLNCAAGYCYQRLGDYNESIPYFQAALTKNMSATRTLWAEYSLGVSYEKTGDAANAAIQYEKVVAATNPNLILHKRAANMLQQLPTNQRVVQILQTYGQIARLTTKQVNEINDIATGDVVGPWAPVLQQVADRYWRVARAGDPNATDKTRSAIDLWQKQQTTRRLDYLYSNIGDAYFSLGEWQNAIDAYMNQRTETACFRMAECYKKLGDKEGARTTFLYIMDTWPDSTLATIARIRKDKL